MAVSVDRTNGIVHCWIRNATTNEIDYPSFEVRYWEFIRFEIQRSNYWTNLPTGVFPGMHLASSVCPYLARSGSARRRARSDLPHPRAGGRQ